MDKIANILILTVTVILFLWNYFNSNSSSSIIDFYIKLKLDLFISFIIISLTCLVNLIHLSKKDHSGYWDVELYPIKWDSNLDSKIKAKGKMLLTKKKSGFYLGDMYLEWVNNEGKIVFQGLYDIKLYFKRYGNIIAESIMVLRKGNEQKYSSNNIDLPLITKCEYDLKLKGNIINGIATMAQTGTASQFNAYRSK